jgi:hypothetical protein
MEQCPQTLFAARFTQNEENRRRDGCQVLRASRTREIPVSTIQRVLELVLDVHARVQSLAFSPVVLGFLRQCLCCTVPGQLGLWRRKLSFHNSE